ncbi:MAG: RHS repeat-associated core domain-containing protein [Acidobacteriota bacterium]|nr:RHS repeat-associated core domain-containing protein [Acidobacteriota bacterium]
MTGQYSSTTAIHEYGVDVGLFTSKERDSETGLDFFGARYMSSAQGRFTSPDEFTGGPISAFGGAPPAPGPLPYADITNPQSLNKYAYAYNNPLRYVDPDGHCIEDFCVLEAIAVGAAINAGVQALSNFFTGQKTTLRGEIGAAVGGGIIGGTAGAGTELGIAVQVAIVGSSGMVGGIAERGIKSGSLNEAMKNPGEMATDFATTAVGHGVSKTVEALATTAERGAVQSLSAQQARATTASRFEKVTGRLENAENRLGTKERYAGAAAVGGYDLTRKTVQQQKKNCSSTLEGCP